MTLLVGFALTAVSVRELGEANEAERERNLASRAQERAALFESITDGIGTLLGTAAAVAETTDGSESAFRRAVEPRLSTTVLTNAVLIDSAQRPAGRVTAVVGTRPRHLDKFDEECWEAIRTAARRGRLTVMPAGMSKGVQLLGLAAATRPGSRYVVYSEVVVPQGIGPVDRETGTDELDYAFYLGAESPENLVVSNTSELPIRGQRVVRRIAMGGARPLVVMGDRSGAPGLLSPQLWLVLVVGVFVTAIIGALVEWNRRRRIAAVNLVKHLRIANAELEASEGALRSAEERFRALVEEVPLVTYMDALDELATTQYMSPQVVDLLGWSVEHWLSDPRHFIDAIHPDDRDRFLELAAEHVSGKPFSLEYRLVDRLGRTRWVLDEAVVERDAEGKPVRSRGFMLDITARKEAEGALEKQAELNRHQALHDSVTGLPNRRLFQMRVEEAVAQAAATGEFACVLLIDLDHFKDVNDTLGHQRGDLLLQGLAERLREIVRRDDTVARLGGDEFGVVARGVGADDAMAMAHGIRNALASPVPVAGLELEVGASIGISIYPTHGSDVDDLIRHADVALYRSKEVRLPVVYAAEHDHFSPSRLRLLTGLRSAIRNDELILRFQPQVTATSGAMEGVEALVRWQHPQLGLVMPDEFIPLAEHTDLIRPLTLHVLENALDQCRAWHEQGHELGVAVNVTTRDLIDARFPDAVAARLARAAVRPELLTLEITEGAVLTDPVRARDVLAKLSAIGVRIAIDDFGVGYSSLGTLKSLPIHVLKIDKSFVLGMAADEDDAAIVRSTIDLAHNLGLQVVAEGVETEDVWMILTALGCDVVQGFHFAQPLPAEQVVGVASACPWSCEPDAPDRSASTAASTSSREFPHPLVAHGS